jgi:hypothetical protein
MKLILLLGISLAGACFAEDTATVYVYRPEAVNAWARKMTLSLDGHLFAYLQNGRFVKLKIPAGQHVLSDKKPDINIRFSAEPSRIYYFLTEFVGHGKIGFDTRFSLQGEETGVGDLRRLKPNNRSQIRDWSIVAEPAR